MQSKILLCFLVVLGINLAASGRPYYAGDSCSNEHGRYLGGWGWGKGRGQGYGYGDGSGWRNGGRYGGNRNFDLTRSGASSKRGASWERVPMKRYSNYATIAPTANCYSNVSPDGNVKSWGSSSSSGKFLK
jgi:hypothetical protein